ncbi:MAG: Slp family lipoprotein [Gammaproteobacteria bacterium]|jgi:outer membrane lipoprotein|nr:Slp family lipoprotein [Gammaproteobacteria bacterium]
MDFNVVKYAGLAMLLLIGHGCASPASSISQAEVEDLSLLQVRDAGDTYVGSTVRWGGIVTEVENKADKTWVFLVDRALRNNEKPITDSSSDGRFIASFNGFIDPLVYKVGRPLTVVGSIEGSTVRAIGEYDYQFPIVTVRDSHLWAEPAKTRVYYPPPPYWYYDMYYYRPYPHRYPHW